jgi:hypothetical protein
MAPSLMLPVSVVERLFPPTVRVFEPRKKVPEPSIDPAVVPPDRRSPKPTAPVPLATSRAAPPEEFPAKIVLAPSLVMMVAFSALAASVKRSKDPELLVICALPAELSPANEMSLLFVITASNAVLF